MYTLYSTDNTGWSATKAVYGDIKHLLCFWHVDRYTRNNVPCTMCRNYYEFTTIIIYMPEPGKTS